MITTKTGDDGKSRWSGKVVAKDSPLLEAVGTLDELQAAIGVAQSSLRGAFKRRSNLNEIAAAYGLAMTHVQKDLYEIMGEIAYGSKITNYELLITNLEKEIQDIEKKLKPLTKFLIFKNEEARKLNWVRTVCRRCERRLVTLSQSQQIDPSILIYINRLSDYLFMMARLREDAGVR